MCRLTGLSRRHMLKSRGKPKRGIMKRFTRPVACGFVFLAVIVWSSTVWAQSARMSSGGAGRSSSISPRAASSGGNTAPSARSGAPRAGGGRGLVVAPGSQAPAVQSFPNALGNSMSFHAFPPVTTAPGYGNINQPGSGPGAPPAYGNINNPGGPPVRGPMTTPQPQMRWGTPGSGRGAGVHRGEQRGGRAGERRGEHRRPVIIPYYYAVPYAPYYFYDQPYGYAPEPEAPPPAEQPAYSEQPTYSGQPAYPQPPTDSSTGPRLYYVPPETTGSLPEEPPPAFEPQLDTSPRPKARPVTLLAFKDQTVVAVTDYWLKGEEIYYKRGDTEVGIPIEQLDFALTQQLNQERHVPFTLESRP
jgi:hypothetical protein